MGTKGTLSTLGTLVLWYFGYPGILSTYSDTFGTLVFWYSTTFWFYSGTLGTLVLYYSGTMILRILWVQWELGTMGILGY